MARATTTSIACLLMLTTSVSCQNWSSPIAKNYRLAEVGYSASISFDGRILVYADSGEGTTNDHVFVLDRRTGQKWQLTRSDEEEVGDVIVSLDGERVAYEWLLRDGSHELRVSDVRGTGVEVVYRDEAVRRVDPKDWSSDGKRIAVWTRKQDGSSQLGVISIEQGSLGVVKTFPTPQGSDPVRFSPDGRYLAFTARPQADLAQRDIFVMSLEQNDESQVIAHPADDFLLDWSPDGKHLLFASNRTGQYELWLAEIVEGKATSSAERVEVQPGNVEEGLGFTNDGSFYYARRGWTNDLYVSSYDHVSGTVGTVEKQVSHVSFDSAAQWSPDGRYLAYFLGTGYLENPFVLGIRTAAGDSERLVDVARLIRLGSHAVQPHWSPDGRYLLAQGRDRDFQGPGKDSQGLHRIDAETGAVTPIVQTDTACPHDCLEWPVWSPEGKAIFMRWLPTSTGNSKDEHYKATIVAREYETGHEQEIYRAVPPARVYHLAASPDGERLAFLERASEKGPAAIKVIGTSGGPAHELAKLPAPKSSGYGQPVFALAWTPDSNYLIYAPTRAAQQPEFELWRIAVHGGEPQHLGVTLAGLLPYGLSVHPDGKSIALTAGTPVRFEVWVLENFLPAEP